MLRVILRYWLRVLNLKSHRFYKVLGTTKLTSWSFFLPFLPYPCFRLDFGGLVRQIDFFFSFLKFRLGQQVKLYIYIYIYICMSACAFQICQFYLFSILELGLKFSLNWTRDENKVAHKLAGYAQHVSSPLYWLEPWRKLHLV